MATGGADGPGLEKLMLAVLRSGTPLAEGLRDQLTVLIQWLVAETAKPGNEPAGTELCHALLDFRDRGGEPASGTAAPEESGDEPGASFETPAVSAAGATSQNGADAVDSGTDDTDNDADGAERLPEPGPVETAATRLRELWAALRADPVAGQYCLPYGQPQGADEDVITWLWSHLRLIYLRLPDRKAAEIRQRAAEAVADYPGQQLPELVPDGAPTGTESEPGPPEVAELRKLVSQLWKWPGLADTVIWLHWLAWHDEAVKCAQRDINKAGPVAFNLTYRERLTKYLTDWLERLRDAEPDSAQEAYHLAKLDEGLRGVLPIPLPEEDSWWTARLKASSDMLDHHASHDESVKVLPLDLNNTVEWQNSFDITDVVNINAEETAGGRGKSGERVWILAYPAAPPGDDELKKGRFIVVR